ncbi:MAG: DNA cytosine methyltransferase [Methylacidiphilales bacterium]|nr:DNA cytosine methyltransferase [Candidatus Methylacidiphilales bacterium]
MKKFTTVSLFSGGMGLDAGLATVGRFQLLACVEKENSFCETIRKNRDSGRLPSNLRVVEVDIKKLDPVKFRNSLGLAPGQLDVLVGGPPCQSFSTAGKRESVQDPRGTLLWDYLRFVEVFQPKFFLMENVRGLLSAALKHRPISLRPEKGGGPLSESEQPGSVIRLFCEDLQKISGGPYHMDCFEVNSANYGSPQIRERAIFIGNRFNAQVEFPNPTHGFNDSDSENLLFQIEGTKLKPWATLRDAIGDLKEIDPEILDFSPRKKDFLKMIPEGANWRSLPVEIQKKSMGGAWVAKGGRSGWWRRLTFDLPCPTLVTMPNHASTSLCHPTETRALSLKEYARVQEFPDEWEFCGTTAEKYAQVGNAVPVRLARIAGEVLASEMDKLGKREWKVTGSATSVFRLIYIQSHVRTRSWYKNGETVIWDENEKLSRYGSPKTFRKTRVLSH